MTRSPDNLIPSGDEQSSVEKWDDKAFGCQTGGEVNARAATQVNAVSASSTPPAITLTQLELFPGASQSPDGEACHESENSENQPIRRDGVEGGGTRRQRNKITGETLFGPAEEFYGTESAGREAYKGNPRNRRNDAEQGVGGGHSTREARDNRVEGRTATSNKRAKRGKATGLPPRGKAQPRSKTRRRKPPKRMDKARKLQRTLYRTAKSQPERRLTLLYDKVCRIDILEEAWRRVKTNGGAAGVDKQSIDAVREYGEARFLQELQQELRAETYHVNHVRRVHIPKPGQPGRSRPLGIPTVKDRVAQMAVKLIVEPLFEADFRPCSYGFRPKRTPRMALSEIVQSLKAGYTHVVDVDLKSYFDSVPHARLTGYLERRFEDGRLLELLRRIIAAYRNEQGIGLPIGSLTSQHFANFYLGWLDRFVKESLRVPRYVRYMDDLVFWHPSRAALIEIHARCREFAATQLALEFNPGEIRRTDSGVAFLGCRLFPTHGELNRRSKRRWRRRVRVLQRAERLGLLSEFNLQQRLTSLTVLAQAAGVKSWRFRRRVLQDRTVD